MRILLIEDNAELATNVGDYLALRGHQMDYAGDGLTGLHLCVTQHYDAVVLDVGLPGLDGVTLCRKLRGEAALTLPVLMLTARDTLDDKVTGLDAGADRLPGQAVRTARTGGTPECARATRRQRRSSPPPAGGRPESRPRHADRAARRTRTQAHADRLQAARVAHARRPSGGRSGTPGVGAVG